VRPDYGCIMLRQINVEVKEHYDSREDKGDNVRIGKKIPFGFFRLFHTGSPRFIVSRRLYGATVRLASWRNTSLSGMNVP
jgi:hypothetical protein